ncbi:MAG TPA: sulfite exporter TauE/SafE family protein [Planctomycetota bacterium]|jgi:hypothetical protein|nr:sulfite exporter TauE/SafE family protein [Planctomycetota bacterium]
MSGAAPRGHPRALLAALGTLAGFASASLGIGGGNVLVPSLAGFLRVPLKRAIGTSLLVVLPVSAVAVAVEAWGHPENLRWLDALVLAAGSLPGAVAGAVLVARVPDRPLRLLFAAFLAFAAARMLGLLEFDAARGLPPPLAVPLGIAVGFLAGLTASLFGIGGGVVVVPALVAGLGVPFHAARATSLAVIVPTTAAAAWRHCRLGTPDPSLYLPMIPSALLGSAAGVFAVNALPAREMRIAFGIFLLLAAARLLARRKGAEAVRV